MKAYNHVSEKIDVVYKDLTSGKAAPMGGVGYLSLEDSEVRGWRSFFISAAGGLTPHTGALCCRYQVPRYATDETLP